MASYGQGEQEMAKALGSATFIRSPGPGAQQETQGRQLGRLQVGSSPWPTASNEIACLLEPAGGKKQKRSKALPPRLLGVLGPPWPLFSSGLVMASGPHPPSTFCRLPTSSAVPLCPSLPSTTSLSPHLLICIPSPLLLSP